MFSVCAKTCSNNDRGHMNMRIKFIFTQPLLQSNYYMASVVVSSGGSKSLITMHLVFIST